MGSLRSRSRRSSRLASHQRLVNNLENSHSLIRDQIARFGLDTLLELTAEATAPYTPGKNQIMIIIQ